MLNYDHGITEVVWYREASKTSSQTSWNDLLQKPVARTV